MDINKFYALIIGVGGDLPVTVSDAEAVKNVLIDQRRGGYDPGNVICLTNEEATKDKIELGLDLIIEQVEANPQSTVVIYYSGHGARYTVNYKEVYLLKAYGYDLKDRESTMVEGKVFSDKINQINADKLLVMLDCCHASGIKSKDIFEEQEEVVKPSSKELMATLSQGKGRVFISSCDDNEQSLILRDARNSLFTEVLLEALDGKLNEGEEYINVMDLLYHITKQVPRRVPDVLIQQRPIINEIVDLSPDYYVCRNGNYGDVRTKGLIQDPEMGKRMRVAKQEKQLEFLRRYDCKL